MGLRCKPRSRLQVQQPLNALTRTVPVHPRPSACVQDDRQSPLGIWLRGLECSAAEVEAGAGPRDPVDFTMQLVAVAPRLEIVAAKLLLSTLYFVPIALQFSLYLPYRRVLSSLVRATPRPHGAPGRGDRSCFNTYKRGAAVHRLTYHHAFTRARRTRSTARGVGAPQT
jgi:hypothetical protein